MQIQKTHLGMLKPAVFNVNTEINITGSMANALNYISNQIYIDQVRTSNYSSDWYVYLHASKH